MNVDDGHLITDRYYDGLSEEERSKYQQVPKHLTIAAQLELMGKEETFVGLDSTGSLSKWAKVKAKAKKRKMNKVCCR